jgi:PAS domain S-box-containing protein
MALPHSPLARVLLQQRDVLTAALATALDLPPGTAAPAYVDAWLDGITESVDGGADRTAGWVARLVEGARAEGRGPEGALAILRALRGALIGLADSGAVPAGDHPALHAEIGTLMDRHALHLAQHCVQSERDAAAAARRRLRTLAESVDLPFAALDSEGVIQLANSLMAQAVGLGLEALPGRELTEFTDPEAAAELRRCFRQKRAAPCRQFGGTVAGPHQPGARVRINVRPMFDAAGLRDGWAVSLEPTEIRGESVAQYLQTVFDQVADAIRAGLQVAHRDGRILYENPLCRSVFAEQGVAPGRLCCHMLRHRAGRAACICGHVTETGETFTEELLLHEESGPRWYNLTVVPVRERGGEITQVASILRDVSAHRHLETRVLHQQRNSLALQVAVSVAHQLRNPLGVVLGFAEMLQDGLAPDRLPMVSERLLRNAIRCRQIVEDILEFGHSQPGQRTAIALERLLQDQVQPLYVQDRERIAWEIGESLGAVACVPGQLTQVFSSLLDNALHAARSRVTVTAWREESHLYVRVRDDGPGIPIDLRPRIFLPFFTTRKEEAAVGLGLSLSQSVISEYGGQLSLEEDSGEGASFLVRLPVATAEAIAPAPAPARPRILIVDDELDLLDMLGTALELRGYTVDMAGSAAEATALLMRNTYAGAVFDVQLPGVLGGPELYEQVLREQPELAARTLFITADTMNFETQRFLNRVQRPSMEKPFLVSEFVARMERMLDEPPIPGETTRKPLDLPVIS